MPLNKIDSICRQLTAADLTLMVIVEDGCGVGMPIQPKTITGMIAGASNEESRRVLDRLVDLGVLDKTPSTYRVTSMGAEALSREVADWEPSVPEQRRREAEEAAAAQARLN